MPNILNINILFHNIKCVNGDCDPNTIFDVQTNQKEKYTLESIVVLVPIGYQLEYFK